MEQQTSVFTPCVDVWEQATVNLGIHKIKLNNVNLWTFTNNSGKWNYNADGVARICWGAMWGGKNRHCRICGEPGVASCRRGSSNSLLNKIGEGKLGAFKEKQARYFASCFGWRLYLWLQWPLVSLCSSDNWCTLKKRRKRRKRNRDDVRAMEGIPF